MTKLDWEKAKVRDAMPKPTDSDRLRQRNRPGNKVRARARAQGSRVAAQAKFLADYPEVTCHACGQRPEAGTIYRYYRRRGWKNPWCVHIRSYCTAQEQSEDK